MPRSGREASWRRGQDFDSVIVAQHVLVAILAMNQFPIDGGRQPVALVIESGQKLRKRGGGDCLGFAIDDQLHWVFLCFSYLEKMSSAASAAMVGASRKPWR